MTDRPAARDRFGGATPMIPLDHAMAFLSAVHPTPQSSALIEITGLGPKRKPVKRYFTDVTLAATHALELNAIPSCYSVFASVNPRTAFSGYEADVAAVSAIFLDLQPERTDIDGVIRRMTDFGIPPTIRAVSGQGQHAYLLLRDAAEPRAAKSVAERLCKATGSDPVFNTNRIARLPGSLNWKKERPLWSYLLGLWPERRFELGHVDAALDAMGAPPARNRSQYVDPGPQASAEGEDWWFELKDRIPMHAREIIAWGERNEYSEKQLSRSEADWLVVCSLVRAGASDEQIRWVYDTQPVGWMKYREAGPRYLNHTIEAARRSEAKIVKISRRSRPVDVVRHPTGRTTDRWRRAF